MGNTWNMKVLAIDPGTKQSAAVVYDAVVGKPDDHITIENEDMLKIVADLSNDDDIEYCFIETIECFGMPVGRSVFATCEWIGMFMLQWRMSGKRLFRVKRAEVKMSLCQNMRAKDSNIRQSIMDIYGDSRETVIGTKHRKGPLYGIRKDEWSALGIAIVGCDKVRMQDELIGANA